MMNKPCSSQLYRLIKIYMKINVPVKILICLLGFLSVGAVIGGGALMISPYGNLLQMPVSMLGSSPFNNYLIPGFILFFFLGIIPGLLVFALIRKPEYKICEALNLFNDMHWAWTFSIYVALALIIWIQVEMIMLNIVMWLQTFYMGFAIVMILITLLPQVRNEYHACLACHSNYCF